MKDFEISFLTENCKKIYQRKKHVTLGISPFTSKYNELYIKKIIQWANLNFEEFSILLDGNESKNLLECLGYSSSKANQKVRKEIKRQIRFCEDAILKCNKTITNRIHRFSDFKQHISYIELYQQIVNQFNTDSDFRSCCLKMSLKALQSKKENLNKPVLITDESLEYAAQYVLAELPFFLNANPIINTQETILAYHAPWKLGTDIINNKFNLKMDKNQGYIILTEKGDNYVKSL
ncbi:TPA: tRNA-dependent cyclodipeptide synthase [Staphylococcus aureus]|nr:tRNA-dependent cyclodipeptide synthase [Staphylococcus aureus]